MVFRTSLVPIEGKSEEAIARFGVRYKAGRSNDRHDKIRNKICDVSINEMINRVRKESMQDSQRRTVIVKVRLG